jgi:hypothetical protein
MSMDENHSRAIIANLFSVSGDGLSEVLPESPTDQILTRLLGRAASATKSPRDYALASFSSMYSLAVPFMKAGLSEISRGEAIYLAELADSLLGRGGRIRQLVLASESKAKYRYSRKVEAEVFASAFLKTEGTDNYEGLLNSFLGLLAGTGSLSDADREAIEKAMSETEAEIFHKKIQVLNPLPGYFSKSALRAGDARIPKSVLELASHSIEVFDTAPWTLEPMVPILKDLVFNTQAGTLRCDSIGLSALSPLLPMLEKQGVAAIVLKIQNGVLKTLSLTREPATTPSMPKYGPIRAMFGLVTLLTENQTLAENVRIDRTVDVSLEKNVFFACICMGAVATPNNPYLAIEGVEHLLSIRQNKIEPAVETFVFEPRIETAVLLDPVAVPFNGPSDKYSHFRSTRLCFYPVDPTIMTPVHQGGVCIGVDNHSYSSAAIDFGGQIAKGILSESFSFLSGANGMDEIAENYEEALALIKAKYSGSPAMKRLLAETASGEPSDEELLDLITGRFGQTNGLSAEVYSLVYQQSFESEPAMFNIFVQASRFLSNIRSFPERFTLSSYLEK